MKIEPGKYYRTQNGEKVGPMEETDNGDPGGFWGAPCGLYRKDGTFGYGSECYCSDLDIVAEWEDEETGTLAELNVKPGDLVSYCGLHEYEVGENRHLIRVDTGDDCGRYALWDTSSSFRIISRASDNPKTWGEMTDADRKDISFAAMSGKPIELDGGSFGWCAWDGRTPLCETHQPIRIKPEPKRETESLYVFYNSGFGVEGTSGTDWPATHRITFTTTDGEPDLDSITMERV